MTECKKILYANATNNKCLLCVFGFDLSSRSELYPSMLLFSLSWAGASTQSICHSNKGQPQSQLEKEDGETTHAAAEKGFNRIERIETEERKTMPRIPPDGGKSRCPKQRIFASTDAPSLDTQNGGSNCAIVVRFQSSAVTFEGRPLHQRPFSIHQRRQGERRMKC